MIDENKTLAFRLNVQLYTKKLDHKSKTTEVLVSLHPRKASRDRVALYPTLLIPNGRKIVVYVRHLPPPPPIPVLGSLNSCSVFLYQRHNYDDGNL